MIRLCLNVWHAIIIIVLWIVIPPTTYSFHHHPTLLPLITIITIISPVSLCLLRVPIPHIDDEIDRVQQYSLLRVSRNVLVQTSLQAQRWLNIHPYLISQRTDKDSLILHNHLKPEYQAMLRQVDLQLGKHVTNCWWLRLSTLWLKNEMTCLLSIQILYLTFINSNLPRQTVYPQYTLIQVICQKRYILGFEIVFVLI